MRGYPKTTKQGIPIPLPCEYAADRRRTIATADDTIVNPAYGLSPPLCTTPLQPPMPAAR